MKDEPTIECTVQFSIPEHQVLLSFTDDEDAERFQQWWHEFGEDHFASAFPE